MSMNKLEQLLADLQQRFDTQLVKSIHALDEITLEINAPDIIEVATALRDEFNFSMLVDLCGVDYAKYGHSDWQPEASSTGFSRGINATLEQPVADDSQRFAVVYHLLSIENNLRVRLRAWATANPPRIDTVTEIWKSADWFEREAFDLFGILFNNHPDLRRILTDYGFNGHPFRKDFPLTGDVQMRYDDEQKRVVYEPNEVEQRVQIPRVIR